MDKRTAESIASTTAVSREPRATAGEISGDDAFDIGRYRRVLWEARKRLVVAVAISLALGMLLLQILPSQYTATAVVRPPDTTGGGLSASLSALSGIGGIASLFANADTSDYNTYNVLLTSVTLGNYIAKHNPELLPIMFPTHWDADNKKWTNEGTVNELKGIIKSFLGMPQWQQPNGEDVASYIAGTVSISNDYKTNFTTISLTNTNPGFTKALVEAIYIGADDIVREQARRRSLNRIAYLEKLLPSVTQTDEHQALIQLLAASEQTLMMVRADKFYAMRPVSPPLLPTRRSGPSSFLILLVLVMLGAGLEYCRALYLPNVSLSGPFREYWSRRRGGGEVTHQASRVA
jgi:hypothetical protein